MKKLKIISCTDPMMWYAGLVGELVEYKRTIFSEEVYMSRDKGGYNNIIYMKDAELIEVGEC